MTELTFEKTSRTVTTPKGELHYHVAGDGPPILLLHGSGPGVSAWANFRGNLSAFAEHFTTYALDQPGFGRVTRRTPTRSWRRRQRCSTSSTPWRSRRSRSSATRWAGPCQPVSLPITRTASAAWSPSVASGSACSTRRPPEGIKLLVQFVEDPTRERLVKWMESMVFDPSILTDEFVEMRWEAANDPAAQTDIKMLFNSAALVAPTARRRQPRPGPGGDAHTIKAPTLITWGRDDRVTPLDGCLVPMRLISKAELHVFYDCGHWAMIERKDEFESVVISFLMRDLPR